MKLAPVNGANVCQLEFVSEMDVFRTCFNFQTINQVGVLQQVLVTNITVV